MILKKSQIVGHCIVRFLEYYLGANGEIASAWYGFVLESGIHFEFPQSAQHDFQATAIRDGADDLTFLDQDEITHSPIVAVLRPIDDRDFDEESIVVQLTSGHWISLLTSAPKSVGGPQMIISRDTPDNLGELIDFWLCKSN